MRLLSFVIFPAFLLPWACGKLQRLARPKWKSMWHTFFLVEELRLRMIRYLWLFDCLIYNHGIVVFHSFPMIRGLSLPFDPKKWCGLKTQTIQYQNWVKRGIFSQEPMGSPFQNIFKAELFQSTFWLNSAYDAIFPVQNQTGAIPTATLQNWASAK